MDNAQGTSGVEVKFVDSGMTTNGEGIAAWTYPTVSARKPGEQKGLDTPVVLCRKRFRLSVAVLFYSTAVLKGYR